MESTERGHGNPELAQGFRVVMISRYASLHRGFCSFEIDLPQGLIMLLAPVFTGQNEPARRIESRLNAKFS